MAIKNPTSFTKEKRVMQLQLACDSIKEMAESIIGAEKYPMSWKVSIVMNTGEPPSILVEKEVFPHKVLENQGDCL